MGPAHSQIVNKTNKKICVITFNNADLLYGYYHSIYVIEPGETKEIQAASDPIGLKCGIVYDASPEDQSLLYQRFQCKNSSVLTITFVNGQDVSTFGDNTVTIGKGKVKERDPSTFALAVEALTYQGPVSRSANRK